MELKKSFSTIVFILLTTLVVGLIFTFTKISELENRLSQLEHKIENPEHKIVPVK